MNYEISKGEFPVVTCNLTDGEKMITEKGSMVWMTPNMEMKTQGWRPWQNVFQGILR